MENDSFKCILLLFKFNFQGPLRQTHTTWAASHQLKLLLTDCSPQFAHLISPTDFFFFMHFQNNHRNCSSAVMSSLFFFFAILFPQMTLFHIHTLLRHCRASSLAIFFRFHAARRLILPSLLASFFQENTFLNSDAFLGKQFSPKLSDVGFQTDVRRARRRRCECAFTSESFTPTLKLHL